MTFVSILATQTLVAKVLDQHGDSMPGQAITWSTSNPFVATVDTAGVVTSRHNGTATVTATSGSINQPLSVGVAQVAATATKIGGDGQIANPGVQLGLPIALQVYDASGNPALGVSVTFAIVSGGGILSTPNSITDASGTALTTWTIGGSGVQAVTATAGTLAPVSFTSNLVSAPVSGFQITVINVGPPFSPAVQAAFDAATAFWQQAIVADIPDIGPFTTPAGQCGAGSPAVGPVTVDDVVIVARFDSIDGPGKILGQAGPCYIRSTGKLTIEGTMRFDTADVALMINNQILNQVIRHEMAHVLGFGTLWGAAQGFGCLQNASSSGNFLDTYYSCARGRAVFDSIGGTSYTGGQSVPVENCFGINGCGAGTYNSHWRESVFFNEIMTGYVNTGPSVTNPLSALTIAAMEDMGYTVNYAAAESYSRTFSVPPALGGASLTQRMNLEGDILALPLHVLSPSGQLVRVIQP